MKAYTEIKEAMKIAFGSNVFTKEFTDKWEIYKGSATQAEDAKRIAANYTATGFYAKTKTIYFDGTPLTFWTAIKPKA